LLVNKRHHNPRNRGNCLMMHVVYFGRTRYDILSLDFTIGKQGSTSYLVIQFSIIRAMPRLRYHTSYFFVWGCGLQLLGSCGLSWFSARNVRPWYQACMVPFQNICTTLSGSYNNDNLVWYVRKWLLYGTQLNATLVRLIITN